MLLAASGLLALRDRLDPPPDWQEIALANNLPNRRAYVLPLNNPDMIPAAAAVYMEDEDLVLGIFLGGQPRAYPWWLTSNYHVVNDTVNDEPVLITLCEVCGGAGAFRPTLPELPGIPLSFQICGVRLGTIELLDHQTQSKWRPFLGIAVEGPLRGRRLEKHPLVLMTWREWRQFYPHSVVANGSPQLRERIHGAEAGCIGDPDIPAPFERSANLSDTRLGLHDLVLGISFPELNQSYAVPVTRLVPFPNIYQVSLGRKRLLIVRQSELAVTAFEVGPASEATDFAVIATAPIQFRGSDGLVWNLFGVSSTPDGRDLELPRTRSYLTEWYEWASHSPQSEIVDAVTVLADNPGAAPTPFTERVQ